MRFDSMLNPEDLHSFAEYPSLNGPQFPQAALDHFLRLGFERARFYDIAPNHPHGDILVLTARSPNDDDQPSIGFRIKTSDYQALTGSDSHRPRVMTAADFLENHPAWIAELGLGDRCWVDIPLYAAQKLCGWIACDWTGERTDLGEPHLSVLQVLGALIAGHRALSPVRVIDPSTDELTQLTTMPSVDSLVKASLEVFCRRLNSAIGAVFEYSWITDTLVKKFEVPHPDWEITLFDFPEEYAAGHRLTGKAWIDSDLRFISDFRSREGTPEAAPESVERHNNLLGHIESVVYYVIGRSEPRYLLRFINRVDSPDLPFITPREALESLGEQLTNAVDDKVARERIERLRELALTVVQFDNAMSRVAGEVKAAMAAEGINSYVILTHSPDISNRFTFVERVGPIFEDWNPEGGGRWSADSLYVEAAQKLENFARRVIWVNRHLPGEGFLAGYLHAKGISVVIAFPIAAGGTSGTLLFPLLRAYSQDSRPVRRRMESTPPEKLRTIEAYGALAAGAVETAQSHLTYVGARKLVAHIGHELTIPVRDISDRSISAIRIAKEYLNDDGASAEEASQLIIDLEDKIREGAFQLHQMLELALLVSQVGDSAIQFHYSRYALQSILLQASDTVWREYRQYNDRSLRSELDPSCDSLGIIACDQFLLMQAFINLIRNAVKYSFPREAGEPIVVRITGERVGSESIVRIWNWGLGIPQDMLETIFDPFVRGEVVDRVRALRGMGLGLYIVRLIIQGHDGIVRCNYSRPTWNDPERLKKLEGYETEFEVRLPQTDRMGTIPRILPGAR
jgi:signal transduction histidine kinase